MITLLDGTGYNCRRGIELSAVRARDCHDDC